MRRFAFMPAVSRKLCSGQGVACKPQAAEDVGGDRGPRFCQSTFARSCRGARSCETEHFCAYAPAGWLGSPPGTA